MPVLRSRARACVAANGCRLLVHVIKPGSDIVLRITAALTLHKMVKDQDFVPAQFVPLLAVSYGSFFVYSSLLLCLTEAAPGLLPLAAASAGGSAVALPASRRG